MPKFIVKNEVFKDEQEFLEIECNTTDDIQYTVINRGRMLEQLISEGETITIEKQSIFPESLCSEVDEMVMSSEYETYRYPTNEYHELFGKPGGNIKTISPKSNEFEVIGYDKEIQDGIELVVWICKTKDNVTFNYRPKGTHEERSELYKIADNYIGKYLTVVFQEYTDDGIPRFPVREGFHNDDETIRLIKKLDYPTLMKNTINPTESFQINFYDYKQLHFQMKVSGSHEPSEYIKCLENLSIILMELSKLVCGDLHTILKVKETSVQTIINQLSYINGDSIADNKKLELNILTNEYISDNLKELYFKTNHGTNVEQLKSNYFIFNPEVDINKISIVLFYIPTLISNNLDKGKTFEVYSENVKITFKLIKTTTFDDEFSEDITPDENENENSQLQTIKQLETIKELKKKSINKIIERFLKTVIEERELYNIKYKGYEEYRNEEQLYNCNTLSKIFTDMFYYVKYMNFLFHNLIFQDYKLFNDYYKYILEIKIKPKEQTQQVAKEQTQKLAKKQIVENYSDEMTTSMPESIILFLKKIDD